MPKRKPRQHDRLCKREACPVCAGRVPLAHFWSAKTDHQLMVLHRANVRTIADLEKRTRFEIDRLRGFGPVGMAELLRIMNFLRVDFNPKGQMELKFRPRVGKPQKKKRK